MKSLSLLFILCFIRPYLSFHFCPIHTRIITDLTGCDVCRCCKFSDSDEFIADCRDLRLVTIPSMTRSVTQLLLSNNTIERLHLNSFPYLPNLRLLDLSQNPLIYVTSNAFRLLPQLEELTIYLKDQQKTMLFLQSAQKLNKLTLRCYKKLSVETQSDMFRGTNLSYIRSGDDCALYMDEQVLSTGSSFPEVTYTGLPTYINMPHSTVNLVTRGLTSSEQCLKLDTLHVKKLICTCYTNTLDITETMFNSTDHVTTLNFTVFAQRTGRVEKVGEANIQRLSLEVLNISADWVERFCEAINTTHISELELKSDQRLESSALTINFFNCIKKIGVTDLSLYNIRIPKISPEMVTGLNLTKLEFYNCHIGNFTIAPLRKLPYLKHLHLSDVTSMIVSLPELLQTLPHLQSLILNQIKMLNLLQMDLPSHDALTKLDLSNNPSFLYSGNLILSRLVNLREIHLLRSIDRQKVHLQKTYLQNLSHVKCLVLAKNNLSPITNGLDMFLGLDSLQELDISGNLLHKINDSQFRLLMNPISRTLKLLDVSNNNIEYVTAESMADLTNLRRLNLGRNRLKTIGDKIFSPMTSMSELLLYGNLIETLNVETFKSLPYLRRFYIVLNHFRCVCQLREFRDWVKSEAKDNRINIRGTNEICYYPERLRVQKLKILDYQMAWIDCDNHLEMVLGAIGMVIIIIVVCISVVAYYYRYDIIFWWVITRKNIRRGPYQRLYTEEEKFDAYLSYSSNDSEFATFLWKALENGEDIKYKIAYDGRDFIAGEFRADNIAALMGNSEKIIFLISRDFLSSEWAKYELRMGEMRCFEERNNLVILVFIEDIPKRELPRTLQTIARQTTCLTWPGEKNIRSCQVFWKRLKLALNKNRGD